MNIKKILKITAIVSGGVLLIGGIVVGTTGVWPVARVGASMITYNAFRDNFTMADHFYRSNIKIEGESDQVMAARDIQRDLQRATMEGLIERVLIDRELEKRYSEEDLDRLIENKIEGVDLTSKEMREAMDLVYGLTPKGFKELILIPKARQEILEGNLSLQNGTFYDWLTEQKTASKTSVFIPSLYWDGKAVQVK